MGTTNFDFINPGIEVFEKETAKFLNDFGQETLLGKDFLEKIGDGSGEEKLEKIVSLSRKSNNEEFFSELQERLRCGGCKEIKIGEIILPYHFLCFILELILPGKGFITIKSVEQFEKVAHMKVDEKEKNGLQKVIETYPVRLSKHVLRQSILSDAIKYQYFPFVDELNDEGLVNTWVGQFMLEPLEQMYQNRPIFVLNMACPVYCRFCFRKHKDCRNSSPPTVDDVKKGFQHINNQKKIKEVLLTGGDPFMNESTLKTAVVEALKVPHLRTLRIATRSISYYPDLFYEKNNYWMEYLKRTSILLNQNGKKLEIATHFLHPDEISFQSMNIISELVKNGIPVYVQTPFLKNCNDKEELSQLYPRLREAGAEIHYIFMPCTPLKGNRKYVSTIDSALKAANNLTVSVSDRAIPKMCTATAIGKIDWFSSGWAVEKADEKYTWIRTPYTLDYFKEFCPEFSLKSFEGVKARENKEGTIDMTFMVDDGNKNLLLGERVPQKTKFDFDERKLKENQEKFLNDQRTTFSISSSPKGILRKSKIKAEIDIDQEINFSFFEKNKEINEIIISSKNDPIDNLETLENILKKLYFIENISAIRIRSLKFNYFPEEYDFAVINILAEFNKLSLVNPKRIEIETQFLHSSEIKEAHKELIVKLGEKGITVYNNTPIIKDVNNNGEEFEKITNHLRDSGIEFNVSYVNYDKITLHNFIDIASHVRMYGSGREIPKYFLLTSLGEVNFGIDTLFFRKEGKIFAELLPFSKEYFEKFGINFEERDGHPIVEVENLIFEDNFMIVS